MSDDGRFDRRMSHSDALLWHIEKDPILRSTIVAVATLDAAPDWSRLKRRVNHATLAIPRMRQRVVSSPLRIGTPQWVTDPDFELDFHLRRVALPAPASWRDLLDFVAPIASAAFDRARPLWEFVLVDGLEDGRSALVLKVHHAVTDGVGGMDLLTRMVDTQRDAPEPADSPPAPEPERVDAAGILASTIDSARHDLATNGRRLAEWMASTAMSVLHDPFEAAERGADTLRSIARVLAPATEPMSPVMRQRGLGRRLDTIEYSLDDVKRAAKAAQGSVNDAFVAGAVGGLCRYHTRHDAPTDRLRMTMPINLRSAGDTSVGNHFSPARFAVPASELKPAERLAAVRALVREWRAEPALSMSEGIASVLDRLPTAVTTTLFGSMLKCVDFVATNVPGAPVPVFVAGSAVESFYAFAPPAGAAVNLALVSHVDRCGIGVVIDTRAVPDPDVLMDDLRAGFDEMIALG